MPDTLTRTQAEDEFFSKHIYMSYSALNRLLFSPQLYYNDYILRNREPEVEKHLSEGKLIHCLLLTPDLFDDEFVVTPRDMPSDNTVKVLNKLLLYRKFSDENLRSDDLLDYQEEILDILKDMNLHQALKTDTQRIEKVTLEKDVEYWNYLLRADGRTVVDDNQVESARTAVDRIKSRTQIMQLLGQMRDPMERIMVLNEFFIQHDFENRDLPFGVKGFLDNVVVDHDNRKIFINDLKKSSKNILSFKESIEYYRYDLQAAMYYTLVTHTLGEEYEGYEVEFRFVVVDNMAQVAPYFVSEKTMESWCKNLTEALAKAAYHFETRSFDLPYEFLVNFEQEL